MIGGLDPGLRVGGRCVHVSTSKRGYIMGMSIEGATTVKVQWDDGDSTSRYIGILPFRLLELCITICLTFCGDVIKSIQ